MSTTKIEWADMTINPVVGCSKCSPGCDNCYAEKFAARLAKNSKTAAKYAGVLDAHGKWTGRVRGLWMNGIADIHSKKRSKRIFMGSMTDMFHDGVADDMLFKMFAYAALCPQHTFMFLTKRPERMRDFISDTSTRANDIRGMHYKGIANCFGCDANMDGLCWPLPNVWLGVTVCNQDEADAKIPILLQTPAARRFVSVEPMLGPVDMTRISCTGYETPDVRFTLDALRGRSESSSHINYDEKRLDWIVCGGETGPGARPMHPNWVRSLRDQCSEAGVPFFFKGWGEWTPAFLRPDGGYQCNQDVDIPDGFRANCRIDYKHPDIRLYKVGKRRAGRLLDGREWNEVPS